MGTRCLTTIASNDQVDTIKRSKILIIMAHSYCTGTGTGTGKGQGAGQGAGKWVLVLVPVPCPCPCLGVVFAIHGMIYKPIVPGPVPVQCE